MYACSKRSWMPLPFSMMYRMMCQMPPRRTDTAAQQPELANIVDTAGAAGGFETLLAAVRVAGLAETLKGDGPFTLFAPTNEAFAKLPAAAVDELLAPENREKLRRILTYHVAPGRFTAADLARLKAVETASGDRLGVGVEIQSQNGPEVRGILSVGKTPLIRTDLACTNGLVHVINRVLMPVAVV